MNWASSTASKVGGIVPLSHVATTLLVPAVNRLIQGPQARAGIAGVLGRAISSVFGSSSNTTLNAVQNAMPSLKEVAVSVVVPTLISAAHSKFSSTPLDSPVDDVNGEGSPYKYISSLRKPVNIQAGATYTFGNVRGGTVIDVTDGSMSIIGFTQLKTLSQQWTLQDAGANLFFIKNGAGLYLSIADKAVNGSYLTATTNKNHPWSIFADEQDESCIRIFYPGSSLTIELSNRGDSTAGTAVKLGRASPGDFQVWRADKFDFTQAK